MKSVINCITDFLVSIKDGIVNGFKWVGNKISTVINFLFRRKQKDGEESDEDTKKSKKKKKKKDKKNHETSTENSKKDVESARSSSNEKTSNDKKEKESGDNTIRPYAKILKFTKRNNDKELSDKEIDKRIKTRLPYVNGIRQVLKMDYIIPGDNGIYGWTVQAEEEYDKKCEEFDKNTEAGVIDNEIIKLDPVDGLYYIDYDFAMYGVDPSDVNTYKATIEDEPDTDSVKKLNKYYLKLRKYFIGV